MVQEITKDIQLLLVCFYGLQRWGKT